MRYLTTLLFAFLLVGCAGTGETRSDYQYREVTEVDASSDQIYTRSLTWMTEFFVASNEAIQLRDEKRHRIVANALVPVSFSTLTGSDVEMDLIVEAKDGRFRLTGRNYQLVSEMASVQDRPLKQGHVEHVRARMDSIRQDLARHVESGSDEDW